jgi:hypothetical protein
LIAPSSKSFCTDAHFRTTVKVLTVS